MPALAIISGQTLSAARERNPLQRERRDESANNSARVSIYVYTFVFLDKRRNSLAGWCLKFDFWAIYKKKKKIYVYSGNLGEYEEEKSKQTIAPRVREPKMRFAPMVHTALSLSHSPFIYMYFFSGPVLCGEKKYSKAR